MLFCRCCSLCKKGKLRFCVVERTNITFPTDSGSGTKKCFYGHKKKLLTGGHKSQKLSGAFGPIKAFLRPPKIVLTRLARHVEKKRMKKTTCGLWVQKFDLLHHPLLTGDFFRSDHPQGPILYRTLCSFYILQYSTTEVSPVSSVAEGSNRNCQLRDTTVLKSLDIRRGAYRQKNVSHS